MSRDYAIERGQNNMPVRMWWRGNRPTITPPTKAQIERDKYEHVMNMRRLRESLHGTGEGAGR